MGYAGYGNNSDQSPGKASLEVKRTRSNERKDRAAQAEKSPPSAGPHSEPDLVNPDSTPGAGALPTPGGQDGTDSTSG